MQLQKENILIVDDDINILELLQRHLQSWNYHTYKAVSVKEAVQILRDTKIDLLITDLKMPGLNGVETTKLIRKEFPDIKIIAVDIQGSLAMGGAPKKRSVSGMGSSRPSEFIPLAKIDKKLILHQDIIETGCVELFKEQMIFGGGSSGAVYAAAKQILKNNHDPNVNALIICPDRGHAYIESIYKKQQKLVAHLP